MNTAALQEQAGHPFLFLSIQVLLSKSFYSFRKQNPDSAQKLLYFVFVWFFRIFSLENHPQDILLSKLNCI